MIIGDRDIIHFGDKYMTYEGDLATPEEIKIFEENVVRDIKIQEEIDNRPDVYMESLLPNMIKYFDGIEENYLKKWSREDLIYHLSTEIFDASDCNNTYDSLQEIKDMFPNEYVEALEGYMFGNHDT